MLEQNIHIITNSRREVPLIRKKIKEMLNESRAFNLEFDESASYQLYDVKMLNENLSAAYGGKPMSGVSISFRYDINRMSQKHITSFLDWIMSGIAFKSIDVDEADEKGCIVRYKFDESMNCVYTRKFKDWKRRAT